MFFYDPTFLLLIPVLMLAFYAQSKVKGNYKKYSKFALSSKITGADIARRILDRKGLYDVKIRPIEGMLTDHYDPRSKVVSLSKEVYYGYSVSAAGIAAHETGHALQHADNYSPLVIRASILPVASLGTNLAFPMFFIGFLFAFPALMDLGIIFFAAALLFHLVTLPVEFNASRRAMAELNDGIITNTQEAQGAKAVLNAAALTYIAATLVALVHLVRLLFLRNMRN
jgi:uncharacterized protein